MNRRSRVSAAERSPHRPPKRGERTGRWLFPATLVIIITLVLGACATSGTAPTPTTDAKPAPAAPVPTPTTAAVAVAASPTVAAKPGAEQQIEVGDNFFQPKELSIPVGTTLVWTNKGQRPHTVTADDNSFASETMNNGAVFRQTFDKPGTIRYYCKFHGSPGGVGMAATVSVTAGAAAAPAANVAPTPTFQRVAEAEPTVGALRGTGTVTWRDQTLRNDALRISASDLPPPAAGQIYGAWLLGKDRSLFLGPLLGSGGGPLTLTYVSPNQENLLGVFDKVYITREAQADVGKEPKNVILAGGLPENSVVHIRHVLVSIGSTPKKLGFALGLRQETDEMRRHAEFLRDALNEGNLALEKLHAEHIVNMIEGAKGEHFGDLNRNGKVENPGDGFGMLQNGPQDGYIKGMVDHARLAAESPDATEEIKLHAGHVQIAGENTRVRVTEIRDRALRILKAGQATETREDVLKILALANQTIQGLDVNGDEQIAPIPGEGGVLTAYQHAQLMAGIRLKQEPAAPAAQPAPQAQPSPTAGPAPQATIAPTSTAAPLQPTATARPSVAEVAVEIGDSTFTPKELRVPVGTTVVWTQRGQLPHTVTADDGSFNSDTLRNGAVFRQTFAKAGVFAYHCEFHGGPGGVGMVGVVRVE